jgi:nucleoside-diphosphate-sugar epimerase
VLLSSLAAREPQLSAYAASKQAAEQVVAARPGPWLVVRAPAVYGPGDRETLAYFRGVARGVALRPRVLDARLSLIHVSDLTEVLALALDKPLENSHCEIDDGRIGGYTYLDMQSAAERALGRRARSIAIPRTVMAGLAAVTDLANILGAPVQILTSGKVREIFHTNWAVNDRRLGAAVGFAARFDLARGFADTVDWYRRQGWL